MISSIEITNGEKFKKIDQYQFLELLGRGANGVVYKGLNTENGSFVAIKEMIIGKSEMKAIKTELSFLKKLQHPSIVKYIDAVQKDNRIYLILEYIEGGSLGALVKKSKLEQDVIKLYIKQVLIGLDFLHKEGVIHRDIKGANILITKHGKVKLADFGVAVRIQQSQKTISAAGSPYWIAPQIIIGENQPSTKCDIWSVGCTIIELLTGNPPYFELMQFPALFRIVQDDHPPLPQCSQQCRDFLLKCFIKLQQNRPSSIELLNHPWLKTNIEKQSNNFYSGAERQIELDRQIEQALCPAINYNKLLELSQKKQNIKKILKHPLFYNFLQAKNVSIQSNQYNKNFFLNHGHNNHRKQRILLILKFIRNYAESIHYLQTLQILSTQLQILIKYLQQNVTLHKKQLPFSSVHLKQEQTIIQTTVELIKQIVSIHLKSVEQEKYHFSNYQYIESYQMNISVVTIIMKNILPLFNVVLEYFQFCRAIIQDRDTLVHKLWLCLDELLMAVKKENGDEDDFEKREKFSEKKSNSKISLSHFCELMSTCSILQRAIKLNEQPHLPLNAFLIKLQFTLKILPTLLFLSKFKHKYRIYIKTLIKNIFNVKLFQSQQANQEDNQIFVGKLLLIKELTYWEIGRALLEKLGLIHHLTEYYKTIEISHGTHQFLMVMEIHKKFMYENNFIEPNRLLQSHRYGQTELFQTILQKVQSSSISNRKLLEQKISKLLSIVQQA